MMASLIPLPIPGSPPNGIAGLALLVRRLAWMRPWCWSLSCVETQRLRRSSLRLSMRRTRFFNSGTPESAPPQVLQSFQKEYEPIGTAREAEAIRYASNGMR